MISYTRMVSILVAAFSLASFAMPVLAEEDGACREDNKKMKERMEEIKQACAADLKQFCANVTPGQGRDIACLKSYEDKISAGCKEKLPKHGGKHRGMKQGDHDEAPP